MKNQKLKKAARTFVVLLAVFVLACALSSVAFAENATAAAAAVDAKLPELVTALTGGLLGSDAAEQNAAQIRQWVAPAHEG